MEKRIKNKFHSSGSLDTDSSRNVSTLKLNLTWIDNHQDVCYHPGYHFLLESVLSFQQMSDILFQSYILS